MKTVPKTNPDNDFVGNYVLDDTRRCNAKTRKSQRFFQRLRGLAPLR